MEEQQISLWYELVANNLNVLAIAVPLRIQVPPDETLESAYNKALIEWTREDSVVLVRDQSRIHGYLTFNDEFFKAELSEMVGNKVKPITCDMLVTSTTPLLEFVPLLQQRPFYFVIDRNEITHIVWFWNVDKAPMQLCLFSLCLELESQILEVLKFHPKGINHCLQNMSPEKMVNAKKVCKQKYTKETDYYLLMSTNFADRYRMPKAESKIYDSLPFGSHKKTDSFFNRVERVRNQIAHSDSILFVLDTPESFCDFIETCRKIISTLRQVRFEE